MRVAHVINTAEDGGGAEHLLQLTRGLAGHGFQSTVIVGRDGPARARLRETGVSVEVVGPLGAGAPLRIAAVLARLRPDLVHLHGSRAGLAGSLAARSRGVRPVLYTAHMFSFHRRWPMLLRWVAARAEAVTCGLADRVICVSGADRDAAARWGIGIRNFEVVPNGVDAACFMMRQDRRAELGIDSTVPVVGMIARLVPQKDPLVFVRCAARVAAATPAVRFLMVGDGPLRRAVEQEGEGLIRAGRLTLTGWRRDVPELLATLDIAVFPSLWEAQGIALIEAMAASRAVVATRLASHAEIVVDGENGVLVPAGDPIAMARAVESLVQDADRRRAFGSRARATIEERYTLDRMIADTVRIYRSVLAGASRQAR